MNSLLNGVNPYEAPVYQTNIIVLVSLRSLFLEYPILKYLATQKNCSLCQDRNIRNMVNLGK